jgi:1,4-alpha-glucan branching enzyme
VRYFVVDSHAIDHAEPRPQFGVAAPVFTPAGVAAFGRHPTTSKLVWSSKVGYPADYDYREYYRDIGFELDMDYLGPFQYARGVRSHTGIKYHRITGPTEHKELYNPDWAAEAARRHANDFVQRCRAEARRARAGMPFEPVIVSPYDAELFGHWWFEGPTWLEQIGREMAKNGVRPMTLGEAIKAVPPQGPLQLPEGSWGEGGDHRVWLNSNTEWTWDRVYSAEREWVEQLRQGDGGQPELKRVLSQASRELLLLQSSDWQFLITTGSARDYAERRVAEHYADFKRLSEMAHTLRGGSPLSTEAAETLHRLEREDFVFPDLDPSWAQVPKA